MEKLRWMEFPPWDTAVQFDSTPERPQPPGATLPFSPKEGAVACLDSQQLAGRVRRLLKPKRE